MKYLGSKLRIKDFILPIILDGKEDYDFYIEPMAGSLSVIENVTGIKKYASDLNGYLIAMWKTLQEQQTDFLNYLVKQNILTEYGDKWFIERSVYNYYRFLCRKSGYQLLSVEAPIIGFVGFMASFNGRFYDGGYSGIASGRNYIDEQIRNTLKQLPKLHDITFIWNDYEGVSNLPELHTKRGIFYFDPPYAGVKHCELGKNFDYDRFYSHCEKLHADGNKVVISEYCMPSDRFKSIWEMSITNSLNPKNSYQRIEKLFVPC